MRPTSLWPLALAAACGGNDDTTDTDPPPSCDEIVTAPLGQVPVGEWPSGLAEAIPDYTGIGGRYDVDTACSDGTLSLKLTPTSEEELQVVQQPWTSSTLTCGCVTDPLYADDTKYEVLARFEGFDVFVEQFGEPGVDNQSIAAAGSLFGGSAPMSFRACGSLNVNPILGSVYEQVSAVIRLEGGAFTGELVLARTDGTVETCDLSEWELVEGL